MSLLERLTGLNEKAIAERIERTTETMDPSPETVENREL